MTDAPRKPRFNREAAARTLTRRLAMQALYGWQLNPEPWQDLVLAFEQGEEAPKADREYFQRLVSGTCDGVAALDEQLTALGNRPAAELDPIERACLLLGLQELRAHPEVPFRVVISEAVALARKYGATDGDKFVNAVLDRAARELRPHEVALRD